MKQVERYICDICGTMYTKKEDAIKCEGCHKKPRKIQNCRYQPYTMNGKGYPVAITLDFGNGDSVIYKR